jgi:hypothetical protein
MHCLVVAISRYFSKGEPKPSSPDSLDAQKQDELWDLSMKATGLSKASFTAAYFPSSVGGTTTM